MEAQPDRPDQTDRPNRPATRLACPACLACLALGFLDTCRGDYLVGPQGRRWAARFTVHSPSVLRHPGNWCIYDNVFTWDIPKSIANFEKHGVPFEEAATVFGDANGLDWDDVAHSHQEQRFKRLGLSVSKRLLLVVYTVRRTEHEKEKFRIISARTASRRERQAYTRLTD